MSNEHDDDEIRESIPCVTVLLQPKDQDIGASIVAVPVGYGVYCTGQVVFRGKPVEASGIVGAWDHAIAREKARRAREGKPKPADKAAAMLAEVIRERDELKGTLDDALHDRDRVRAEYKEVLLERDDALYRVIRERDELRAKLERVRGVQRHRIVVEYSLHPYDWVEDDDGDWVSASDIDDILGKDGEA